MHQNLLFREKQIFDHECPFSESTNSTIAKNRSLSSEQEVGAVICVLVA